MLFLLDKFFLYIIISQEDNISILFIFSFLHSVSSLYKKRFILNRFSYLSPFVTNHKSLFSFSLEVLRGFYYPMVTFFLIETIVAATTFEIITVTTTDGCLLGDYHDGHLHDDLLLTLPPEAITWWFKWKWFFTCNLHFRRLSGSWTVRLKRYTLPILLE